MDYDWQVRQKHHEDTLKAFRETGVVDSCGRVRLFRGTEFHALFRQLGHSSGLLESCTCWISRTTEKDPAWARLGMVAS